MRDGVRFRAAGCFRAGARFRAGVLPPAAPRRDFLAGAFAFDAFLPAAFLLVAFRAGCFLRVALPTAFLPAGFFFRADFRARAAPREAFFLDPFAAVAPRPDPRRVDFDFGLGFGLALDREVDLDLDWAFDVRFDFDFDLDLADDLGRDLDLGFDLARDLDVDLAPDLDAVFPFRAFRPGFAFVPVFFGFLGIAAPPRPRVVGPPHGPGRRLRGAPPLEHSPNPPSNQGFPRPSFGHLPNWQCAGRRGRSAPGPPAGLARGERRGVRPHEPACRTRTGKQKTVTGVLPERLARACASA
ncbi:MAG: hypothetical protein ACRELV_16120 [Longimicrobiales bacterium]